MKKRLQLSSKGDSHIRFPVNFEKKFKGTVMQIKIELINDHLHVSKVS